MEERADKQLIEDYSSGDNQAFAALVDRFLALVMSFINSIISDKPVAEELTQEVFLKVWKNLKKFDTDKNFKTWILAIAKNSAIDYLRKRRIRDWDMSSIDDDLEGAGELASLEPLPDEVYERKELAAQVNKLVGELKPIERSLVNLYYQEQLTFEEIAEILGESVNTVKSRHRRLLLKLRQKF